jgi:hypothetical protein
MRNFTWTYLPSKACVPHLTWDLQSPRIWSRSVAWKQGVHTKNLLLTPIISHLLQTAFLAWKSRPHPTDFLRVCCCVRLPESELRITFFLLHAYGRPSSFFVFAEFFFLCVLCLSTLQLASQTRIRDWLPSILIQVVSILWVVVSMLLWTCLSLDLAIHALLADLAALSGFWLTLLLHSSACAILYTGNS